MSARNLLVLLTCVVGCIGFLAAASPDAKKGDPRGGLLQRVEKLEMDVSSLTTKNEELEKSVQELTASRQKLLGTLSNFCVDVYRDMDGLVAGFEVTNDEINRQGHDSWNGKLVGAINAHGYAYGHETGQRSGDRHGVIAIKSKSFEEKARAIVGQGDINRWAQ